MTQNFLKKFTALFIIVLTVLSGFTGIIPTVQASGVGLVKDIRDSYDPDVKFLIDVNGTLYFRALGEFGYELWKSDGTENGTLVVKSSEAFNDYENLKYFTKVNENLYFSATDSDGIELWISNGTGVGTKVVKNIDSNFGPSFLTDINGVLFFVTDNSMYGSQIWKTNGTAGGTNIVINPTYFTYNQKPLYLTNVNGMLFFSHHDDLYGRELWKTDGLNTFGEPVLVKDINESSNSSPANLISINGDLYFTADDGVNGRELWISDGTEIGTELVRNIRSGVAGSSPNNLTNVDGVLYFTADDGLNGVELWKSDGTEIGTELVRNIRSGVAGSSPSNLTNVGGDLYFTADDGVNGVELWKSDGVTGVTEMVKNINENSSSSPANLANINGILYFSADNGTNGKELWKSDGTANGTVMIKDIAPGSNGSDPSYMVNFNNQIFFSATDGTHGRELYSLTLPTLSISSTHTIMEFSTSTSASISVSLDQASNVDITFSLTTSGTATLNTDYTLDNTTYTIPAGETSVNVLFTPINNYLDQANKVAELVLSSTDAFISDTQATSTITITDDDVSSTTLTDSSMIVHKNQTTGVYKVVLNAQPTSDVVIAPTSLQTGLSINPRLTLTFTSGNWNTYQNITVTLTDPANTNYQTSYITHSITSDDSNYSAHVQQQILLSH
jgi:ELWxxDGT repeat protein